MSQRAAGTAVAAALCLIQVGCAGSNANEPNRDIVVFAAASLTESFTEIGRRFEAEHPRVQVTFSFGGSSSLGPQIVAGAPADVFASASPETMQVVVDASAVAGEPVTFARNRLQIAVPTGNPAGVDGLSDLAEAGLVVALCDPEVPCGAAAQSALEAGGIDAAPDTLEQDVKAVTTKIELAEVDAGLVYRTDVLAAGDDVEGIDFPEAATAVNDYLIASLRGASSPAAAGAFVDYVRSPVGRDVLTDAGFGHR